MSADEDKDVTPDASEQRQAREQAASKKPAAKKAAAAKVDAAGNDAGGEDGSEPQAKAAKKRAAKKAAASKADAEPAVEPAVESVAASEPTADSKPAGRKKAAAEKAPAGEAAQDKPARARRGASKAAAKAPRRRVVSAHARYVRTSARKARMVCGHLRGKSVQEARAILAFTPREVARDWSKLLESAVANAESNHELLEDDLVVRDAYADEGPTIKRFRPRAMGRATPIRKRTSHLTIALTPRPQDANSKRNG
jgi:ribosomal protein L22